MLKETARVLRDATENLNIDPQTGFAPTVWNAWVDNWTGQERVTRQQTDNIKKVVRMGYQI